MKKNVPLMIVFIAVLILSACTVNGTPQVNESGYIDAVSEAAGDAAVETITVWDYYGEATPIEPLVARFEAENPGIKVNVEALDWDTMLEKINVVLTGGDAPDVVTIDMTWLPRMASLGAFTDLNAYANGQLNGVNLDEAFTAGAMDAMTYQDTLPTILYDFDVYALYYRADLLEAAGLSVPANWDELQSTALAINDGDLYKYAVLPDTFHASQFIYENGGSLLNDDETEAVFNTAEAAAAVQYTKDMLDSGAGIYWSYDEGELIQGIKDGRVAMFSDGPYVMGIMKSSAPEMEGLWKIAAHPHSTQPGSYLGGTGLSVPVNAQHKEAAWKFIEFAMRQENQVNLYNVAGAAPALIEALNAAEVNAADPYFGDQQVFSVFLDVMDSARPFPYVREWGEIDATITTVIESVLLDEAGVQEALDTGVEDTNMLLQ